MCFNILAVGVIVALLGRRQAATFAVVAVAATFVVAGPWWGYQTSRFGNPIKSNLERDGYMLERQPRSFFVSLPFPELVTRPYRESFRNELLPIRQRAEPSSVYRCRHRAISVHWTAIS